jgi:hypothetical protein
VRKYEIVADLMLQVFRLRRYKTEKAKSSFSRETFGQFLVLTKFLSIIQGVIQTNEVRKSLGNIHFIQLRIFVLDDILEIVYWDES